MWLIDRLNSCWEWISGGALVILLFLKKHWLFVGIFSGTSLVLSVVGCGVLITYLPPDYFDETKKVRPIKNIVLRILLLVIKNIVGGILIIIGALLAVPGIPGQGLLTILTGLIISDFPGKKRLARRIIRIQAVFTAANSIRTHFNRPPLILKDDEKLSLPDNSN